MQRCMEALRCLTVLGIGVHGLKENLAFLNLFGLQLCSMWHQMNLLGNRDPWLTSCRSSEQRAYSFSRAFRVPE